MHEMSGSQSTHSSSELSDTDSLLPSVLVSGSEVAGRPEGKLDVWRKNTQLYRHVYETHRGYDYYFFSGPDTYLPRLRLLLLQRP